MIIGTALRWHAFQGAMFADDWDHYAMQQHIYPVARRPWDMFNFVSTDPASRDALLRTGRLPWWTALNIHLAVFRPVSSLLVYLDFSVFDAQHHFERLHLHSLVWWLFLLTAVASLLKNLLPPRAAAIGVLLYAVDDAHNLPMAWAANRSEIVAVAFVICALRVNIAARERQSLKLSVVAMLLVALGLLSGEHALPAVAYLAAFELIGQQISVGSRIRRFLLLVALVAIYLVIRSMLGYGVAGSAFYIEPLVEPVRFAAVFFSRVPLLLADLVFGYSAEWWFWGPSWQDARWLHRLLPARFLTIDSLQHFQLGLGVASALICLTVIGWLIHARQARAHRSLTWLLTGAFASLLPLSGTAAMSRLTLVPAIAVDAGLGYFLWRIGETLLTQRWRGQQILAAICGAGLIQLHLVRAAALTYEGTRALSEMSGRELRWVQHGQFGGTKLSIRRIIIVSAADMATQFSIPFILHLDGFAGPLSSQTLSPASGNRHLLKRLASNVLELDLPDPVLGAPFRRSVYRPDNADFHVGEKIVGPNFDVIVGEIRDGEPTRFMFTFPASVESPEYLFLYPTDRGLTSLTLPPVGRAIRLPPPSWPR